MNDAHFLQSCRTVVCIVESLRIILGAIDDVDDDVIYLQQVRSWLLQPS